MDGPPDETAELRWIRRKVLHLSHCLLACCDMIALYDGRRCQRVGETGSGLSVLNGVAYECYECCFHRPLHAALP